MPGLNFNLAFFTRGLIYILLLYLPLDAGGHHPRPLLFLRLTAFLLLACWLLWEQSSKKVPVVLKYAALSFLGISLLSSCCASAPFDSISGWYNWAGFLIFFVLAYYSFDSEQAFKQGVHALMLAGFLFALNALHIYLQLINAGYNSPLYGTFYQADMAAAFLLSGSILALSLYLEAQGSERVLYGLIALVCSTSLLLTLSRAGGLCLAAGTLLLLVIKAYYERRKIKQYLLRLVLLAAFIWLAAFLIALPQGQKHFNERVQERASSLVTGGDSSVTARWYFWKGALKLSGEYPLLGIGFEAFGRYYPQVEENARYFSKYVHNSFLEMCCEVGYPAFLAFLLLLAYNFYYFYVLIKRYAREEVFPYLLGLIVASLAMLAHSLVDVDFKFAALPFYLTIMSGMALSRMDTSAVKQAQPYLRFLGIAVLISIFPLSLLAGADNLTRSAEDSIPLNNEALTVNMLNRALTLAPIKSSAYELRGDIAFKDWQQSKTADKLQAALQDAQAAVRWDKHRALYRYFLAQVYLAGGQEDKFLEEMQQALNLDPVNYPGFYNQLADYWRSKGELDTALSYYQKVDKLYGDFTLQGLWNFRLEPLKRDLSITYRSMGDVYNFKADYLKAGLFYRKALDLNAQNAEAWIGLCYARYEAGNYAEALKALRQAEIYAPESEAVKKLREKLKLGE
jgi:O-antigen ligase